MPAPVIFLDVDGVLMTGRAWAMPENAGACERARLDPKAAAMTARFDPAAMGLLNELVRDTGARLVISSSWRYTVGPDQTLAKLVEQGVSADSFHVEWCCPLNRFRSDKLRDIRSWLDVNRLTPMPLAPSLPCNDPQREGWREQHDQAMARHWQAVDNVGFPFVTIDDYGDLPRLVRTFSFDGLTPEICEAVRRELAFQGSLA